MQNEVHLLLSVSRPEVYCHQKEGYIDITRTSMVRKDFLRQRNTAHSTSTMVLSSLLTIILATAAGARGLRS